LNFKKSGQTETIYSKSLKRDKKDKSVPLTDHQDKLETILKNLKERGASAVKLIDIADIVVDERVRLKCQVPLCDSYRKNLLCPPYAPAIHEFREALHRYAIAILIQVSANLKKTHADAPSEEIFLPARKLHELVHFGEKEAFAVGYRFATGLIGGCCRLCNECVAANGSTKCRFPFKARPSMEAVGIDVVATVATGGLPVTFPIGNKVTWTGLILL
jgi:predicted metal-binding protein